MRDKTIVTNIQSLNYIQTYNVDFDDFVPLFYLSVSDMLIIYPKG